MGEKSNAHRVLLGNPPGKRRYGRSTCRWVDNIKMDLEGITWLRKVKNLWDVVKNGNELTVCTKCDKVWTSDQIIGTS